MNEIAQESSVQSHASVQASRQLEDARRFLLSGDYEQARNSCLDVLERHPEFVGALTLLGRVYLAQENYDGALPCFLRAVMLSPRNPGVLVRLGQTYQMLDAPELARTTLEQAIDLVPDEADLQDAYDYLGRNALFFSDYSRAADCFAKALEIAPENAPIALELGEAQAIAGDEKAALKTFESALKSGLPTGDETRARYGMSRLAGSAAVDKKNAAALDKLDIESWDNDDPKEKALGEAYLRGARALIADRQGEHDTAWEELSAANELMKTSQEGLVPSDTFDDGAIQRAAGWALAPSAPALGQGGIPVSLFICGPVGAINRGAEQLAGQLENVFRGHDSKIVSLATAEAFNQANMLPLMFPGQLPNALLEQFTSSYVKLLKQSAGDSSLFTVRNRDLILDLGRIAETVPKAHFIFVSGDRDDMAFRLLSDIRPPGLYDLAQIDEHLDRYERIGEAWGRVLGDRFLRLSYADMVSEPAKTIEQIAGLCGLKAGKAKPVEIENFVGCAQPYIGKMSAAKTGELTDFGGGEWV